MQQGVAAMLLIAAIIHLLPLSGALGANHLARLYGMAFTDPNLVILMRHRAVLFALLGLLLAAAAFRAELRMLACIAGLVSTIAFLAIAWSVGGYNTAVGRVVAADMGATVCLLVALGLHLASPR
jgi:hypothetical protein